MEMTQSSVMGRPFAQRTARQQSAKSQQNKGMETGLLQMVSSANEQKEDKKDVSLMLSEDAQKIMEEQARRAAEAQRMREEVQAAREQTRAAALLARIQTLSKQIFSRIAAGHNVPEADHKFLQYHDKPLYDQAITLRGIHNNDKPKDYDQLSPECGLRSDSGCDHAHIMESPSLNPNRRGGGGVIPPTVSISV